MMKMMVTAVMQTIRAMTGPSSAPPAVLILSTGGVLMRGVYSQAMTVMVALVLVPCISSACTMHTYTPASLVLA